MLGVVLVIVAASALVVDHRVRRQESVRVDGCAVAALDAVRFANARVDAIANYVRPALETDVPASVRRQLLTVVSTSLGPSVGDVRHALDRCDAVRVLSMHSALRAERRDCLLLLRRERAFVTGVAANGLRAFAPRSLPDGRCVGPADSTQARH
jgi:hypothetical protein